MLTDNQIKALAALRAADETIRLQGQAFKDGKACACAVIARDFTPVDIGGDSFTDDSYMVYDTILDLFGQPELNQLIHYNDATTIDTKTPEYTFAQIADQMEARWTA